MGYPNKSKIGSRISWIYPLLLAFSILGGCSSDEGIDIKLPENKRLEDTQAGWWIKELDLSYYDDKKYLVNKISERLSEVGILLDTYIEKEDVYVKKWEISTSRGALIILEKQSQTNDDELFHSFEIPLEPKGIPWKNLIDNQYKQLKPKRKYEHAVTITSSLDKGARLFLFGWGNYCTSIAMW